MCAPAVDTVSDVRVTIAIQKRVNFGERITVVGETDALGRWRPCDGVPLTWSDGDVWSAEISLQPGTHEFKVGQRGRMDRPHKLIIAGPTPAVSWLVVSEATVCSLNRLTIVGCRLQVVTVKPDGKAEWETGSNRVIQVRAAGFI